MMVRYHSFLTMPLDGVSVSFMFQLLNHQGKNPHYPLMCGWMCLRARLDTVEKRTIFCLCQELNHDPSVVHPIMYLLYRLSWPTFMETSVHWVNAGTTASSTVIWIMNHLQCFGAILLAFMHNLITTLGSPIIMDTTHKKVICVTCHSLTVAERRQMELGHMLVKDGY